MKKTKKQVSKIIKDNKNKGNKMLSKVEQYYLDKSGKELMYKPTEKIPIIQVDNFPELGKLTALRFIEWVQENPGGVISLPTGKTPEHFIRWVSYFIKNWDKPEAGEQLMRYGIDPNIKPDMKSLHFVQIDEFYPIDSNQQNSFLYSEILLPKFKFRPKESFAYRC